MKKKTSVDIILPNYNSSKFIAKTISLSSIYGLIISFRKNCKTTSDFRFKPQTLSNSSSLKEYFHQVIEKAFKNSVHNIVINWKLTTFIVFSLDPSMFDIPSLGEIKCESVIKKCNNAIVMPIWKQPLEIVCQF